MSNGKVILVRGIPGCGKTFHVEQLRKQYVSQGIKPGSADDFVVCSADKFFMVRVPVVRDGQTTQETRLEYVYDPSKIARAHSFCMSNYLDALNSGKKVVVVDNTFIHHWEMTNYLKAANIRGYDVDIHEIRVETIEQLRTCVHRNVHKVPAEVISRMALEFETMTGAHVVTMGGVL